MRSFYRNRVQFAIPPLAIFSDESFVKTSTAGGGTALEQTRARKRTKAFDQYKNSVRGPAGSVRKCSCLASLWFTSRCSQIDRKASGPLMS